ncbi:MAG: YHYH protein [Patescibacteria group bacterium]
MKKVTKKRKKEILSKKFQILILLSILVVLFLFISSLFSPTASQVKGISSNAFLSLVTSFQKTTVSSPLDLKKLQLGDNKYTSTPKAGYVYSCEALRSSGQQGMQKVRPSGIMARPSGMPGRQGQNGQSGMVKKIKPSIPSGKTQEKGSGQSQGAYKQGPWINTTANTWDATQKYTVDGAVSWEEAVWTVSTNGTTRMLSGNGLPTYHTTGIYPVASTDDAYQYDRNPNTIAAQTISLSLPTNPTLLSSPQCVSGEVGIMLSGVPLFNAFDATLRDANAWEIQDSCDGHPQKNGQYHYHGYSDCMKDTPQSDGHSGLIGYAFDGFGIFGLKGENGKELATADLDECHGHTHSITWDGAIKSMYHYHVTRDFPYSVGCFRGKAATKQSVLQ